MTGKHIDLRIYQGDTFQRVVRWETKPFVYKAITAITNAAPVVITATGHGLTDGWRVAVINVQGMTQINAPGGGERDTDFTPCTYIDPNTIALNEISSADFEAYASGGYLKFFSPVDLSGYTARMDFKDRVGGTVLNSIDTTGSGIIITPVAQTIQLVIARAVTELFTWRKAVYDLQMIDGSDVETTILTGSVVLTNEVTEGP